MKKSMTRVLAILLSVLSLAVALCGCTGDKKGNSDSSITIGILQDIEETLDPHNMVAAGTKEIFFNVFEGLVKPDSDGNIVPAVASEINVSEDRLNYTFTIREGVKFHDDTIVTADDVVHKWLHETFLEAERCLYSDERQAQDGFAHRYGQPWHQTLQHLGELPVGQQFAEGLPDLAALVWPYVIKFFHYSFLIAQNWFSTISVSTSLMSRPAARTCCGMKLVAVMPGVVLISSMLMRSVPSAFFVTM